MLDAVPGIDRIRIQGFGCIEDVELELGLLQAFIGPNDSGKSTILRAVQTVVEAVLRNDEQLLLLANPLRLETCPTDRGA